MIIRQTQTKDIPALQNVLDDTELFPSEMLPDMLMDFLNDTDSQDLWFTCEMENEAVGFCYATPEKLTEGTWNMLVIAVHTSQQGKGIGGKITKHLEQMLLKLGNRILIVDTSSADAFKATRAFYQKHGYTEGARIRGFWADGDDKIVFWKDLRT